MENEKTKENIGVHPLSILPEILDTVMRNKAILNVLIDVQAEQLHLTNPSKNKEQHKQDLINQANQNLEDHKNVIKTRLPGYFPDAPLLDELS